MTILLLCEECHGTMVRLPKPYCPDCAYMKPVKPPEQWTGIPRPSFDRHEGPLLRDHDEPVEWVV